MSLTSIISLSLALSGLLMGCNEEKNLRAALESSRGQMNSIEAIKEGDGFSLSMSVPADTDQISGQRFNFGQLGAMRQSTRMFFTCPASGSNDSNVSIVSILESFSNGRTISEFYRAQLNCDQASLKIRDLNFDDAYRLSLSVLNSRSEEVFQGVSGKFLTSDQRVAIDMKSPSGDGGRTGDVDIDIRYPKPRFGKLVCHFDGGHEQRNSCVLMQDRGGSQDGEPSRLMPSRIYSCSSHPIKANESVQPSCEIQNIQPGTYSVRTACPENSAPSSYEILAGKTLHVYDLAVCAPAPTVGGIVIKPESFTLKKGDTRQLVAYKKMSPDGRVVPLGAKE
jgi:hypothetical protein